MQTMTAQTFHDRRGSRIEEASIIPGWGTSWAWTGTALAAVVEAELEGSVPTGCPPLGWSSRPMATEREHRHDAFLRGGGPDIPPRVWARSHGRWLGAWVQVVHRDAWRPRGEPDARDDQVRALVHAWLRGDLWTHHEFWTDAFLPIAARAFRSVMARVRVPMGSRHRVLEELEATFAVMLHDRRAPAWPGLIARALESGPEGPVASLAAHLDLEGHRRIARCIVGASGSRGQIARRLLPGSPTPLGREQRLLELLLEHPSTLVAWADAEAALRLAAQWSQGRLVAPESACNAVVQNLGRGRARLRGVLAGAPDVLVRAFLSTPDPWSRLSAALARLTERWAYSELESHFAMGSDVTLAATCSMPATVIPDPLPEATRPSVRAWVLLVVLRGRLTMLRAWIAGRPLGKDSTWDRLQRAIPEALADGRASRKRGYDRLRAHLEDDLDPILTEIATTVLEVSRLDPTALGRALKAEVLRTTSWVWTDDVPAPTIGFPPFCACAVAAVEWLADHNHLEPR